LVQAVDERQWNGVTQGFVMDLPLEEMTGGAWGRA